MVWHLWEHVGFSDAHLRYGNLKPEVDPEGIPVMLVLVPMLTFAF